MDKLFKKFQAVETPEERNDNINNIINVERTNAFDNVSRYESFKKREGHHQQDKFTNVEMSRSIRRQYLCPSHAETGDYNTYGANSYVAAIAITDIIAKKGI